jgi:hypothetical protein
MFDDQQPNVGEPPKNLPAEPMDMFETVEKGKGEENVAPPNALKAGVLKKKESPEVAPQKTEVPKSGSSVFGPTQTMPKSENPPIKHGPSVVKILIGVVGIFAVAGIAYAAKVGYDRFVVSSANRKLSPPPVASTAKNETTETAPVKTATTTLENQSPSILFEDKDTDNDGLTDAEEKQLGTKVDKPDSDGDGLSDGDEVKVWHTDPLKVDTDGDKFQDGQEIMNGYNPLGSGKFTPQLPIVRFVTSTGGTTTTPYSYVNYVIKVGAN